MRSAATQQWLAEAAAVALHLFPSCNAVDFPQLLRAFARVAYRPDRPWITAALARARQLLPDMSAEGLSSLLWACWWLRCAPSVALLQVGERVLFGLGRRGREAEGEG